MRDLLLLLAALHAAFVSSTQSLNLLPKSVRFLYLNIGANVNPIFPPLLNHSIAAVAFEPIVHSAIPKKANLYVVPAAVGAVGGLGMMGVYNNNLFQSSSLSLPASKQPWNKHSHPPVIVPIIGMGDVLESVPESTEIWYLKTDMQGHDFPALSGASTAQLRRVHYMLVETFLDKRSAYAGVNNQFCEHLLPHMLAAGFVPISLATIGHAGRFACEATTRSEDNTQLVAGALRYCSELDGNDKARKTQNWHEADVQLRRNDTSLPPPLEALAESHLQTKPDWRREHVNMWPCT